MSNTLECLRSFRVAKIAIFDVVMSLIGLILIAMTGVLGGTIKNNPITFSVVGLIPISVIAHLLFGVNTQGMKYLGLG